MVDLVPQSAAPPGMHVAVVTRTRDRPIVLARAMTSVLDQTHADWTHVIVNDGGDPNAVAEALGSLGPRYAGRLRVVQCAASVGLGAAINVGIDAVRSDYVAVHDDDDSWHPDFLRRMVAAIRDERAAGVRGAVSHIEAVHERIEDGRAVEVSRHGFNTFFQTVDILRLALSNTFPPIGFVYERSAYDAVGPYDATLAGLVDWEFHLRFALAFEIELVPETLAFYHQRRDDPGSPYANHVIKNDRLQRRTLSRLVNRWLRTDHAAGRMPVTLLRALGELRESALWQNSQWAERTPALGRLAERPER